MQYLLPAVRRVGPCQKDPKVIYRRPKVQRAEYICHDFAVFVCMQYIMADRKIMSLTEPGQKVNINV
jgi:hypothetical protein